MSPLPTDSVSTRAALHEMAARTLTWILAVVGAALLAVEGQQLLAGHHSLVGNHRLFIGLAMLAVAAAAALLRRAGRPRLAMVGVLGGMQLILVAYAALTGLGVHAFTLTIGALLVALAGGVAGDAAAFGLAALYAGGVALLAALEQAGQLSGLRAPVAATLADRVILHLMFAFAGLASALLLNRILGAALRRAIDEEARLARLVQAAHNWEWEADTGLHLTHLSDNFEALSGHRREDFLRLGRPGGAEYVRDADFPAMRADLKARRPYRDRVGCFRSPDGRLLWSLNSGEPVFDKAGVHVGWRGVGHNITSERLAQQQHRRTAELLDRLVRTSPDAIAVARLDDGRLVHANAGFLALIGYSGDEALGRSARELGLWPVSGEAQRLAAALAAAGVLHDFRSAIQLRDGSWRDVLISATTMDWDGQAAAVLVTRDITEAERARIEADAILEHASAGIALTREGLFERVNPHWREIFGGSEPQLAEGSEPLPSAQEIAGGALAFERDFLRPDGSRVTVQCTSRKLPATLAARSESGARAATLWVAVDITARRRQQRELQAAKQQAEAASRAKSAFLATMSHEIRTPLNGVLGLARLMQQPGADPTQKPQYLAHLVSAAESLNEIVSNVLDLSKIEAGHLQLEHIEFDLAALAQAGFEGCAALGRERGLEMRLELAPGLPRRVVGDPLRVRQILANFLVNALKFTERGHVLLALAPAGPGRVRVAVEDSGIGVPPELQPQLFRPFAQADDSTTRRFGGTGLGLSICRELAARMGGRVGVDSDGAKGSTFWAELALPAARPEAGTTPQQPPQRYPLAGQRLLVAEDNPVNRLIITALLHRLGAETVEAEDGEQAVALALAQAGRLDAVLMDLHMPKLDGLRATALLRADPATATLPIHAFTAAVLDQERERALAAGMDGFITKPVVEADLVRVLGRH